MEFNTLLLKFYFIKLIEIMQFIIKCKDILSIMCDKCYITVKINIQTINVMLSLFPPIN